MMHKVLAFIRRDFLVATSYRTNTLFSIGSLVIMIVPVYFVANSLQPLMADPVAEQGGEYFAFLVVGLIAMRFIALGASSIPSAIGAGIQTGTLEVLLVTPTRLPMILTGRMGYAFIWALIQTVVTLIAAACFGAEFVLSHSFGVLLIICLIVLAYVPFGLLAAAMILTVRTSGPLLKAVFLVSTLLGGVYYPTQVIPDWIQSISAVIPLTYALNALRKVLLEGLPLYSVLSDVGTLVLITGGLFVVSAFAFTRALRYARKTGTLAQY